MIFILQTIMEMVPHAHLIQSDDRGSGQGSLTELLPAAVSALSSRQPRAQKKERGSNRGYLRL